MQNSLSIRGVVAGLAVVILLASLAPAVEAAGIAVARFGGEHGNPAEGNPGALYYNPAGIALQGGTDVMIDVLWVFRNATYNRTQFEDGREPTTLDEQANLGESTLNNQLVSPFLGVTTDFGLDIPFSAGLAFFAPFGGQSVWDENAPVEGAPGAIDGTQRWYNIEGTLRTLSATLGVAYQFEDAHLSLGFAGNLLLSTMNTIRARNSDGSDTLTSGGQLQEGRSWLNASTTDFSLGFGVMWEAAEDEMWVGASYQSAPNLDGNMAFEGTLDNLLAIAQPEQNAIAVTQQLPAIIRLGFRYRPSTDLELRLWGDYTSWGVTNEHCIVNTGIPGDNDSVCATEPTGEQSNEEDAARVVQVLQRRWEDTFGGRLSASYWFSDDFEGVLGVGYDGNAIPDSTLEPALQDYEKFTASLGGILTLSDTVAVSLTATNVFYSERDTTGVDTADVLIGASHQPSSAGVYNQNIFLISTGVELSFGGPDSDEAPMVEEEEAEEAPLHEDDGHEHHE
jgi:long-chain fatty acid transport protein